jgi:hemolysin III
VTQSAKKIKPPVEYKQGYPVKEEIINSITHGLGAILAIVALVILIAKAAHHGTIWHLVSFSIFASMLFMLYLFSTLYHALVSRKAKNVFARMDHAAIFLLIAGTYTPFLLISLRGPWGWSIFVVVWALAITGVVIRSIFLVRFRKISTVIYLLMGWSILLAYNTMLINVPALSIRFLVYGGLAYSVGVIFYVWRKLPFHHAIWHLFVLAGSLMHFFAVLYLI